MAWGTGAPAAGELRPAECVLIFNSRSAASRELAEYYAARRDVPKANLLGMDVSSGETLSRREFDEKLRPAIRAFLAKRPADAAVRCLVTFYDVPLRVGPFQPGDEDRRRAEALSGRLTKTLFELRGLADRVAAGHAAAARPGSGAKSRDDAAELAESREAYRAAIAARMASEPPAATEAWREGRRILALLVQEAEGSSGILDRLRPGAELGESPSADAVRSVGEQLTRTEARIAELTAWGADGDAFERALPLIRQARGRFGEATALLQRVRSLRGEETEAALDSELAVVLWGDHEISGWLPNPVHYARSARADHAMQTLMVARLDAPTPALVRRMIDDSIAVERDGLSGVFYIDARGKVEKGLRAFDDDLLTLAEMVRTRTSIPVVVDRRPDVFEAGACPNAALYCGWYSLSKYVDAFDFVPGAVAVHVASFELTSLKKANKPLWCKSLLEDGVAATYGATSEPFLESFPLPTQFFGRLLTGRYTLVEAYSATVPVLSWRLSLLGDPLYNPFRSRPMLPADWDRTDKN
ncbi:MAG: TIGR03790 family protein [Phycisphaerales bacterium]|nr:TIGR03790 family protein [Phycisphaerales bacterium]